MTSSEPLAANAAQAEYWSSAPGRKWVALQDPMDAALSAVNALLLARAAPGPGEAVLEIGCGAGATTLAFAERVGPAGSVLAVDISPPLLARARDRAANHGSRVNFIEADAQTHHFQAASVDLIVSRFGIMFFEDPVAAFANMLTALRPGGRLVAAAGRRRTSTRGSPCHVTPPSRGSGPRPRFLPTRPDRLLSPTANVSSASFARRASRSRRLKPSP